MKSQSTSLLLKTVAFVVLIAFFCLFDASQSFGATLTVPSPPYPTIQSAINAAAPGDTIILQAGVTFVEAVVLKYKPGNEFITIQSSGLASLPVDGRRVSPSDAPNMPKIVPPNSGDSAISTEITVNGASHHYKLIGIEIAQANDSQLLFNLVSLGDGGQAQNSLAKVAHNIIIDRCYIHGTPNGRMSRAIGLNSRDTAITNSYISEIHNVGTEAQGICGWNGPGPFLIENNYIEASTQGLMFGGSDPYIQNLVPQDITVRKNLFSRPLSWFNGTPNWLVKNIFELKNARNVNVSENIFENNWPGGQAGYSILFTVRNQDGGAPWSTVEDVDFSHNIVRNVPYGVNILSTDNIYPSQNTKNISIRYNLFSIVSSLVESPLYGKCIQLTGPQPGIQNLTIDHNTCIGRGEYPDFLLGDGSVQVTGLTVKNNLAASATAGANAAIVGNSTPGTSGLNNIAGSTWQLQRNVLMIPIGSSNYPNSGNNVNYYVGAPSDVGFVNFSAGNYTLAPTSPYLNLGTDGTNPGANIIGLNLLEPCILSGNWASCSGSTAIQSPFPGPSNPGIPAVLEAENFDRGGQGVAYSDVFGSTGSGIYRSNPIESVDIAQNSNASNGHVVFEAAAGEWLEYSASFTNAGLFDFRVRFSSGYSQATSRGTFKIEVCDPTPSGGVSNCESTPDVAVFSTGGWGIFRNVNVPIRVQSSGTKVVRLVLTTNAPGDTGCNCVVANFDSISIEKAHTEFDIDLDSKADLNIYRPTSGDWYSFSSTGSVTAVSFGISSDLVVAADYDGDGRMDYGLFRQSTGTWWIMNSLTLSVSAVSFGLGSDIPVPADYDGDGKADIAVWRPSTGEWIRKNSSDGVVNYFTFGDSNDRPLVGDFDGDGFADYAVYRPSTGSFLIQRTGAGFISYNWGFSTDIAVPADYDGDGKTDIAVWRPSNGVWYAVLSSTGNFYIVSFGVSGDRPTVADYDGDGRADLSIYRPSSGTWWNYLSTSGVTAVSFGISSDFPVPNYKYK